MMAYGMTGGLNEASLAHCEVAQRLAGRLGLQAQVLEALACTFERWDGSGPRRLKGEAIPLSVRVAHLAWDVEVGQRLAEDSHGCLELVRRHAGAGLDPALVERFCRSAPEVLAALEAGSVWDCVLACEPAEQRWLDESEIDTAASIFADFTDLKSAFTAEHSRRVASLGSAAAQRCGLDEPTVRLVRWAGLVHDIGRVALTASAWDRRGPLREAELEQVRLHAYHTERVLRRADALAAAGSLASLHHERLDGSGYHRGAHAGTLSMPARVLAAADAFAAMTEARAYRPAFTPPRAAEVLLAEARAGRLDIDAVRGVLEAAGQPVRRVRRDWPAGLSDREVEVLGLLARGLSMKEIAQRLVVSPKTVDHHVQHIYTKLDVRTRPAARLFAIEHGLAYDGPLEPR
jgi:HD-GYP domain-containing protein (c-di-GMP phosphodiesterase class II)